MGRPRINIDRGLLEKAIQDVQNGNDPPPTLSQLYKRVAEKLGKGATPAAVIGRIKEYDISVQIRDNESKTKIPYAEFSPFTSRGIVVTTVGDLLTSHLKDDDINRKIREAWAEVRRKTGHKKPLTSE